MYTYIVYFAISLIITTTSWQPCHCASIRKTRIATDFEDDPLSRKLVTKSVFIAPTFGCPTGYFMSYDGRCLQIIRISLNNQYDFVLGRLNLMRMNSNEEIFVRNKKDIQEDTSDSETSTPRPITNTSRHYNNIRPVKSTTKRKTDGNTEGPVKIHIPIS